MVLSTETKRNLYEWAKAIVFAVLIAIPVRYFIAEPFIVNGASMDPTFSTGQFLIVDRISYRFTEPQRGDVIVFRYPNNPSTYYIKRIIGLPGETIEIKSGKVCIVEKTSTSTCENLDETYVSPRHYSGEDFKTTLTDTQYFVMGDNRSQSSDSRVWGPLEERFIIGRPVVRLLPPTKLSIYPGEFDHSI
jgi:signal peptidase I